MVVEASTKTAHTVQSPKVPDYLQLRRAIGWVIIALVAASLPLLARQHVAEGWVLILAAVSYNGILYLWAAVKLRWVVSPASILFVDSLIILLLIMFSDGGTNSPYVSLLLFPIITAAIWHGVAVSLAIDMGVLLTIGVWQLVVSPAIVWSDLAKGFGFLMLIFMLIGTYAAKLTYQQRRQQHDMADKDLQIDQERKQLLALINNIGDAVLVIDEQANISLFNDVAAKLVGSQYAMVGRPLVEIFPLIDQGNKPADILAIPQTDDAKRRDLRLPMPDGSVLNIEADISPYIVNQESHGFIIILRDITQEKTLEQEQEEFISVASHELRTPLAIAEANISNTLASNSLPKDSELRVMMDKAHNNIMFLSSIIDDLTTLSSAEQDKLEVDLDPLKPAELINEVGNEYAPQIQAKGLKLIVQSEENVRPILSSRYRVKQVLQNYMTNAIKYTHEGSITIAAANAPKEKDGVIFSVRDSGIGISVSDQKMLFTKFFRSEDYRTRESSGTGLGLYICAKLAQRLNGKVWSDSELKKSSTFYLQVPPFSQLKQDHSKMVKAEAEDFFGSL